MSLYTELRADVDEILSDPDLKQGTVQIRRIVSTAPGANPWDPPVDVVQIIELSAVARTQGSKFDGGTLVSERGDVLTFSAIGRIVSGGAGTVVLEVLKTDVFVVDGDERRVLDVERMPAAGIVVAWKVLVAD